jgi:hypothetical protein
MPLKTENLKPNPRFLGLPRPVCVPSVTLWPTQKLKALILTYFSQF